LFDVYRGKDLRLDRDVHLRLLKPRYARQDDVANALFAAAKQAAAVVHPNLVTVYDVGSFGGRRGLVTEATARKLASDIDPEQLRRVATDYLGGLNAAHCAGLLHGAIDADALFVAADGAGKLADVGLFAAVAGGERDVRLPGVDADLRSLASTLIKQSDGRDRAFEDALRRALSADPSERYPSAETMAEALEAVPPDETVSPTIPTRPIDKAAEAEREPSRPRVVATSALRAVRSVASLVVVLAAVAVLLVVSWNDTDGPTPGRPTTPVERGKDLPPEIPR
jgi:serine/threonine protein kinase